MTGSPSAALPWRRDLEELTRGLAKWVDHYFGDSCRAGSCEMPQNGMANETVLFSVGDEEYAARLAPLEGTAYPTFPKFDLAFQRSCMELVRTRTSVPVPEVIHLEEDPSWVGTPFLIMRRIPGQVPADSPPYLIDGWMARLDPSDLIRLEENTIRTLVELHQIREPADLARFDRPDLGTAPLEQQLAFQRDYYEWAREGRRVPIIEEAFGVLLRNMPAANRRVLNWGDSRIGNIIYQDCIPAGVLDWEMATAGPPEVDLGWMVFFHAFFQKMMEGYGMTGMPGLLRRERAVELYEAVSGERLEDLAWFEALAALRFAIISIRTSLRSIAHDLAEEPADPNGLVMFVPHFRQLLSEVAS